VLVGGRFKHEILGDVLPAARARGLRILSLHGEEDAAVLPGPARASTEAAAAAGLPAEFRSFPGGHAFSEPMRAAARAWISADR
jgi:predicted esterase